MSSKGWTTCDPRTFSWPVRMVFPPVVAHGSPSRYQPVMPSTVRCTGTLSSIDFGALDGPELGGLGEVRVAIDDLEITEDVVVFHKACSR